MPQASNHHSTPALSPWQPISNSIRMRLIFLFLLEAKHTYCKMVCTIYITVITKGCIFWIIITCLKRPMMSLLSDMLHNIHYDKQHTVLCRQISPGGTDYGFTSFSLSGSPLKLHLPHKSKWDGSNESPSVSGQQNRVISFSHIII